jgi:hypothetical protein
MARLNWSALALGVALSLSACGNKDAAAPAAAPMPELRELTVDQVADRIALHDGKTFVYDDNSAKDYAVGHLPGAKWLAPDNVTVADLPADHAATLIFYCHNES